MKAHTYYIIFGRPPTGGKLPPSPLAAPLRRAVKSCRVRVQKHPLVHDNEQCKPIVIETIKFLYDLDMEDGKDVDLTNPIARPRVPHEIMFVIGGWSGGSPTNVIETYDTRADRWITVEYADRGRSPSYTPTTSSDHY